MDELTQGVYNWLDEAFHGVKICEPYIMVPLVNDPPIFARLYDPPEPYGRQFELRVPVLRGVDEMGRALSAMNEQPDVVHEGHLRCVPGIEGNQIEIRYRFEAAGADRFRFVQLCLRLSRYASNVAGPLQAAAGGIQVRSTSRDDTAVSLQVAML